MAPHLGCGPHLPEIPGPLLSKDFLSIAWIIPNPLTHPTPAQGLSKCKFVSKRIVLFLFLELVGYRQCFAFFFDGGVALFSFRKEVPCCLIRKVNIERGVQRAVDFAAGSRRCSL